MFKIFTTIEEYTQHNLKEIQEIRWQDKIIDYGGCCYICGLPDIRIINYPVIKIVELNHIGGRKYSNAIIPMCRNHHGIFTWYQKTNAKKINIFEIELKPDYDLVRLYAIKLDLINLIKVIDEIIKENCG